MIQVNNEFSGLITVQDIASHAWEKETYRTVGQLGDAALS
jgi:hypothetical protein